MRSDVSRTILSKHFVRSTASIFDFIWWSQTGSNRRPHACKARALPAELWPRTRRRMLSHQIVNTILTPVFAPSGSAGHTSLRHLRGCATRSRRRSVVGLGRLELPTSRLSSARSNQLSYKPQRSPHDEERDNSSRASGDKRKMQSHKR